MNLEKNKTIVRRYFNEIVRDRNVAAFGQYLAKDVVFNEVRGFREQHLARMQATVGPSPDFRLMIRG